MDLVKIGKYIAEKRKDAGMTQRQLADKLGMSDKSVSKWERGVCLPDVSVYADLCQNLGISINEFLAGEDIAREDIIQRSEENIISVSTDSKKKQKRLKIIISVLSIIILAVLVVIGITKYRSLQPQNFIRPAEKNSIEMETARILSGPDGAFIYNFTTTDEYRRFYINVYEYHSGQLYSKKCVMELGFDGIGSPENGVIFIVPDFEEYTVKLIFTADGYKMTTEPPILEDAADREYYARGASEITEKTQIRYNEEQALMVLIYDKDTIRSVPVNYIVEGRADTYAENDYMYFFTYEFRKDL